MKQGMDDLGNGLEQGRPALLKLLEAGAVTERDVARLRRDIFAERPPSRIEIEDLFAIDAVARPSSEAWLAFFVETACDFFVWDQRPTGVLVEADAHWLMAKVDVAQTDSSFALLINILDHAHRVPRWFPQAVRARAVTGWASLAADMRRAA